MPNYHLLEKLSPDNLGPERKVKVNHWIKVSFGGNSTVQVELECGHTYELSVAPNTNIKRVYRCGQCHSNNPR